MVNRLFDKVEDLPNDFDVFFESGELRDYNPYEIEERIRAMDESSPDFEAQRQALLITSTAGCRF